MLEYKLKEQTKNDPKMIWPLLWRRFIDDGFGVIKGHRKNVEYFVLKFNSMVDSIKIDKIDFGDKVNFLDLCIYKGLRFSETGKFDIKLYQKEENIYAYIPFRSVHQQHTIANFVIGELKRYVRCNSTLLCFLKDKYSFYKRLRNRGYKKTFLNRIFEKVSYESRNDLLNLNVSNIVCSTQDQEEETKGKGEEVKGSKAPDISLKIGGQYITHRREIDNIFNKELLYFSSINESFNEFLQHYKATIGLPTIGFLCIFQII
jgi:hypothetical protein